MILITTPGKVGREAATLSGQRRTPGPGPGSRPGQASAICATPASRSHAAIWKTRPASTRHLLTLIVSDSCLAGDPRPGAAPSSTAATRAGVRHIVKVTSKASPDSPIARRRGQSEIEAGLAASGVAHTLLRANAYMQNFLMLAPAIAATGGFASSAANGRVGLVDARDVAAVAAQIATHPDEHSGRTYWITGPELLSYGDVADILSGVLDRTIKFSARTAEEDRDAMIAVGVPAPIAEQNAQAFSLIATGDAEWLSDDATKILGHPGRTFRQFAEDHATAFTSRPQPART